MKNETKCNVTIDGTSHNIVFKQKRTKFELYVDGVLAAQLIQTPDEENQEKDVKISGKRCQFVLYGDTPDLVVDGIMKYEAFRELKSQKFHRNVLLGLGFAQCIIGTLFGFMWTILYTAGVYSIGGWMGLVFAVVFALAGAVEMVLGAKKHRRIKEMEL